jgi:hypothetical protein
MVKWVEIVREDQQLQVQGEKELLTPGPSVTLLTK